MNERILALDIGDARIGVAVSDAMRMIATPVEVIKRVGFGPDVKRIKELCQQFDTSIVLSGLPYNMDGTLGFQSEKVKLFCQQLEKAGLTVYYQDERLTTVTAEHALLEGNMHRAQRRQNVDKVAAAIILQQYLDSQAQCTQPTGQESEEPAMTMENENDILELIDEETGDPIAFEHLATVEHEGEYYIVLTPADEEENEEEECEVVILKIEDDEEGNECYVSVDDDALQGIIFEKFLQLMEEDEDE